jgi:predicted nucleic acid-binding protein
MQTQPGPKRVTIQDVINQVKASTEAKLWRLDVMQREDGSELWVYIGRVETHDGSRTFPAVVLRLMRNGAIVRDYTVSTAVMNYILEYLDFATDAKLNALRQFVEAFKTSSRIVNAEEGGEL